MSLLYYPQNYLHLYQHSLLSLFLLILHLVLAGILLFVQSVPEKLLSSINLRFVVETTTFSPK